MKLQVTALTLALSVATSCAVKIPFKRVAGSNPLHRRSGNGGVSVTRPSSSISNSRVFAASSGDDDGIDLTTVHDLIYIANVTVGSTTVPVQLDTGSSDLWIKGDITPLPSSNQTSTTYNLTYGIGWAYGHVSYASAEFAGITVPSQAFLDVSAASNPALSYGADGILGLGFTSLSTIDALVNRTGSSAGRSFLFNLFQDNPSEPNFIAFLLQRSTDPNEDVQGSFSLGETEPAYASVLNQTAIPTWPQNSPSRWNVLLDSIIVGQNTVSLTTVVPNVPSNKAVALLDSGTSYTYAPTDVVSAIYGGVDGAQYDSGLGQWVVPCSAEIDMAIQIGGQVYPIHPLDVSPYSLSDPTTCVGSFVPQSVSVGAGEFDWLIGDNVLRSIYSVYDFGDFDSSGNMGNPYVKLLSIVDPDEASSAFVAVRGGTAKNNITYNASNSSSDSPATVTLSGQLADTLDKVGKYFPAMLAIMALNAVVLILLCVLGIVFLLRRRGGRATSTKSSRRSVPGRGLSPMPMNPIDNSSESLAPPNHVYQPVSMALTDDTFIPPSAAFRKDFDSNNKVGPRPMSVA
ncbi:acid protease [Heliocybe sulcata]|uniref:Acid protease n=1 Tax=Heliocybe sulcata TaxID=5364 RepID=A0A5C3NED9_9AGAM|nr:acid protease [Heliocybe sulcata]